MTNKQYKAQQTKFRRIQRSRVKIWGTSERPRLHVFRSLRYISAQVINDDTQKTLASAHSKTLQNDKKLTKTQQAQEVGKIIAEMAKKAGVTRVVFDRSGRKYHGRVRALAESAKRNGLVF